MSSPSDGTAGSRPRRSKRFFAGTALALLLSGCGGDSECSRLKSELLSQIRAQNPTLDAPKEIYKQEYRDLVAQISRRGCSPAELGTAPLLCYLGHPTEACPPGYECHPEGQEVCRRK